MAKTSINKSESTLDSGQEVEQYTITIPKKLAEALNIEHKQKVEWSIASASALRLDLLNGGDEDD